MILSAWPACCFAGVAHALLFWYLQLDLYNQPLLLLPVTGLWWLSPDWTSLCNESYDSGNTPTQECWTLSSDLTPLPAINPRA